MRSTWIRVLLATSVAAVACGGSPEEELIEASEAAADARVTVEAARVEVKKHEEKLQQAQQQLADAREALRKAESEVASREATVDREATDAVLFRAVQKRLLESRDLESVAIKANVTDGIVTLTGSVPDSKLRDRAVEIAGATPGVASVQNRIQVAVSAPADKKK